MQHHRGHNEEWYELLYVCPQRAHHLQDFTDSLDLFSPLNLPHQHTYSVMKQSHPERPQFVQLVQISQLLLEGTHVLDYLLGMAVLPQRSWRN